MFNIRSKRTTFLLSISISRIKEMVIIGENEAAMIRRAPNAIPPAIAPPGNLPSNFMPGMNRQMQISRPAVKDKTSIRDIEGRFLHADH